MVSTPGVGGDGEPQGKSTFTSGEPAPGDHMYPTFTPTGTGFSGEVEGRGPLSPSRLGRGP